VREFGNVTLTRDSIRRVWRHRWFDAAEALARDIRFALRALLRVKGLAATVVVTLALGIGANAAIFSVVRGVLLRPLVNRDEDRLIYIRQGRPDIESLSFSVLEIDDFKARVTSVRAFGDFSTLDFTLIGLGSEPRSIKSGVVSGSFFDVMGLRPVVGRLLDARDDGPGAQGAVVLTYRFWTRSLNSDPTVIGRTVRLGPSPATIVGVLEPSVPYPADTEIIANVVTSPHHLGATMQKGRTHRMTELFGRLAPGASIESARAELTAVHAAMVHEHPESYSKKLPTQLAVTRLRDQIAAPARTVLLVLLLTAAVVFVIACSNVANLIVARSVRREGELAILAALGAGSGALRRTLLAESLVLCGAGAILGVLLAQPMVAMISEYAARFSIRALEVRADASVLWVGAGLSIAAAVLLAYVPRLPSSQSEARGGLAAGTARMTPGTNRRLRLFATLQIACSFVLLAGASMLLTTLVTTQTSKTGYTNMNHVIAIDVPAQALGVPMKGGAGFFREAAQRIGELPGVEAASFGNVVPWRDPGAFGGSAQITAEGYTPANGEEPPLGRIRTAGPHFFTALGVPLVAGREFTEDEREPVAIVSQMVAQRLFPDGDALNRHIAWQGRWTAADRTPDRRRRRGRRRREHGEAPGDDDLRAELAHARVRRPSVRPDGNRSVFAHAVSDAGRARSRARPVAGTRGDARRHPRGTAFAGARQRVRVLRVRRHRVADRDRRRRKCPGVFGERADAAVRRAPRRRIRPEPARVACHVGGHRDRGDRHRCWRRGRLGARPGRRAIRRGRADARPASDRRRRRVTVCRCRDGLDDAGRARIADRRAQVATIGLAAARLDVANYRRVVQVS
jgi:predicted permease